MKHFNTGYFVTMGIYVILAAAGTAGMIWSCLHPEFTEGLRNPTGIAIPIITICICNISMLLIMRKEDIHKKAPMLCASWMFLAIAIGMSIIR